MSSSGSRTALGDALRQPLAAALPRGAGLRRRSRCCSSGPCWRRFPTAALGAIVVYAALRLIDLAEFRRLARSGAANCCWRWPPPLAVLALGILTGSWSRSACPSPTCCAGSRTRTTASWASSTGIAGMHDVDDHPERPAGARPRRLPLRLAAVLRQRGGLPQPRPGGRARRRRRRRSGSCSTPRPTSRSTSPRSTPSRTLRAELARRGVVFAMARVKQDLRVRLDGGGTGRAGRRRPDLPHAPDRGDAYLDWYATEHGRRPDGW